MSQCLDLILVQAQMRPLKKSFAWFSLLPFRDEFSLNHCSRADEPLMHSWSNFAQLKTTANVHRCSVFSPFVDNGSLWFTRHLSLRKP